MTILLVRIDHPPGGEHLAIRGFSGRSRERGLDRGLRAETLLPREQPLFDRARQAVLTTGDPQLPAPDAGLALWNLIADGDVGRWWREAAQAMDPATTRTVLDVRVPDLQSVPWELMAADGRTPVFRNERHPWVRARTPWQSLAEMPVPVKALVVVGDNRSVDLDVDEELAAVFAALRMMPARWNVEVLSAPSLTQLRRTLAEVQPDVLHIIAHGMEKGREQVLAFTDATGAPWDLTRQDVDAFPAPMPRLVLLETPAAAPPRPRVSARRGASRARSTERGVAAVVAMQGDIPCQRRRRSSRVRSTPDGGRRGGRRGHHPGAPGRLRGAEGPGRHPQLGTPVPVGCGRPRPRAAGARVGPGRAAHRAAAILRGVRAGVQLRRTAPPNVASSGTRLTPRPTGPAQGSCSSPARSRWASPRWCSPCS